MKIKIEMAMPAMVHPEYKSQSVCKKVQEAMTNIESGFTPVDEDWAYLRKIQDLIQKKPNRTDPMQRLLDKIDLFMIKYGRHCADNEHAGEID